MTKVVIFGDNAIAKMVYDDMLRYGNEISIVAFTVDEKYISGDSFCGKPLLSYQKLEQFYPPDEYGILLAVDAPTKMRNRMKVFNRIKDKGYSAPNYISRKADFSDTVKIGESNIIMAFSCIGFDGVMGNANFIRQNVYLGHDFVMGNGNTISSGCSVAGRCTIGDSCFIGVGATVVDFLNIADETLVGAGSVVIKDTESCTRYAGNPAKPIGKHEAAGIMINMHRISQEI
jgi:sugar O-acyltransferase (sialic acid O-acetyltransferase NeuD family)